MPLLILQAFSPLFYSILQCFLTSSCKPTPKALAEATAAMNSLLGVNFLFNFCRCDKMHGTNNLEEGRIYLASQALIFNVQSQDPARTMVGAVCSLPDGQKASVQRQSSSIPPKGTASFTYQPLTGTWLSKVQPLPNNRNEAFRVGSSGAIPDPNSYLQNKNNDVTRPHSI